jgi:hypothetical protein
MTRSGAETRIFSSRELLPAARGPVSEGQNDDFSLFCLIQHGSGPSIALAETASGKLALFGGNPPAWFGVATGLVALEPAIFEA